MAKINCKEYSQQILDNVKNAPKTGKLIIITVGDDPASASYVKGKLKDAAYCGIEAEQIKFSDTEENKVLLTDKLLKLNADPSIGGIIIQLPLPKGWDEKHYTNMVVPEKDVDGFLSDSKFKPCTPEGIIWLAEHEMGDLTGKSVLLIGRGKLIGKPLIPMLLDKNVTLTIAHSKSNWNEILKPHYDIIISGTGKRTLNACEVNTELVIDAGITFDENNKLCGDMFNIDKLDYDLNYTTSPGGIGLLTRAMLMTHMTK